MDGFQILPHTADMRIRVWGGTLQELFGNALRGMAHYLAPAVFSLKGKVTRVRQAISIEAVDVNSLLVEFLSEVIAQSDIKNAVFTKVIFEKFGENFLKGELQGVAVDKFDKDIKAVSYHEVDIKRSPETGMYETALVFDI